MRRFKNHKIEGRPQKLSRRQPGGDSSESHNVQSNGYKISCGNSLMKLAARRPRKAETQSLCLMSTIRRNEKNPRTISQQLSFKFFSCFPQQSKYGRSRVSHASNVDKTIKSRQKQKILPGPRYLCSCVVCVGQKGNHHSHSICCQRINDRSPPTDNCGKVILNHLRHYWNETTFCEDIQESATL